MPDPRVPFRHRIRVRYAEVDGQGVVFNAHWLTYFDEAMTRFVESFGFGAQFWVSEFDVMLVRAVIDWSGPARFDEWVEVDVGARRLGTTSFDVVFAAAVAGRPVCTATITYVSIEPRANRAVAIPGTVRTALEQRVWQPAAGS